MAIVAEVGDMGMSLLFLSKCNNTIKTYQYCHTYVRRGYHGVMKTGIGVNYFNFLKTKAGAYST